MGTKRLKTKGIGCGALEKRVAKLETLVAMLERAESHLKEEVEELHEKVKELSVFEVRGCFGEGGLVEHNPPDCFASWNPRPDAQPKPRKPLWKRWLGL